MKKKVSEKTKKKISNSLKGFKHSLKTRKKMSRLGANNSFYNKKHKSKIRRIISIKIKNLWKNNKYKHVSQMTTKNSVPAFVPLAILIALILLIIFSIVKINNRQKTNISAASDEFVTEGINQNIKLPEFSLPDLFDENKNLLLLKRTDNGKWEPVKGGINPGEEWKEAAFRELKEETGWVLDRLIGLRKVVDWESPNEGAKAARKREFVVAVTVNDMGPDAHQYGIANMPSPDHDDVVLCALSGPLNATVCDPSALVNIACTPVISAVPCGAVTTTFTCSVACPFTIGSTDVL